MITPSDKFSKLASNIFVATFLVLSSVGCSPQRQGQAEQNVVAKVVDAYVASSKTTPASQISDPKNAQWTQDWIERLTTIAAQNPQSPNQSGALAHAEALANSIRDYKRSTQIIQQLIAINKGNASEQFRWYTELGEVIRLLALQTKVVADREDAIKAFQSANLLVDKLPMSSLSYRAMKEQEVLNLGWIGDLYSLSRADRTSQKAAAVSYRGAIEKLQQNTKDAGPPQHRLVGTGYDVPWLARSEAVCLIRAEDYPAALAAMKALVSLPPEKFPPSFYLVQGALTLIPQDRPGYESFLRKWLVEGPPDDYTPVVRYLLAWSHFRAKEFDKAKPLYEDLRANYREAFAKIEGAAMTAGNGGYYSIILIELRQIYLNEHNVKAASSVNSDFLKMYPNYGALTKSSQSLDSSFKTQLEKAASKPDVKQRSREAERGRN